ADGALGPAIVPERIGHELVVVRLRAALAPHVGRDLHPVVAVRHPLAETIDGERVGLTQQIVADHAQPRHLGMRDQDRPESMALLTRGHRRLAQDASHAERDEPNENRRDKYFGQRESISGVPHRHWFSVASQRYDRTPPSWLMLTARTISGLCGWLK